MSEEPMVERLERLEREATPGPWESYQDDDGTWGVCRPEEVPGEPGDGSAFICAGIYEQADAELIAFLPALLSQLREQRDEWDAGERARLQLARELLAAKRTVREQRAVIEAAKAWGAARDDRGADSAVYAHERYADRCRELDRAIASLPPVADEPKPHRYRGAQGVSDGDTDVPLPDTEGTGT